MVNDTIIVARTWQNRCGNQKGCRSTVFFCLFPPVSVPVMASYTKALLPVPTQYHSSTPRCECSDAAHNIGCLHGIYFAMLRS